MAEKFSILTFAGDGSTVNRPITFAGGYISKDHVKAHTTQDSLGLDAPAIDTAFSWVGDFTVLVTPPTPVGYTLTIYRDTPKDMPLVDFTNDVVLDEADLNKGARQAVFIAAEMVDRYGPVDGFSDSISSLYAKVATEAFIRETADGVTAGIIETIQGDIETISTDLEGTVTQTDVDASILSERSITLTRESALALATTTLNTDYQSFKTATNGTISGLVTNATFTSVTTALSNADSAEVTNRIAAIATLHTTINGETATSISASASSVTAAYVSAIAAEATRADSVSAGYYASGVSYTDAKASTITTAYTNAIVAEATRADGVSASFASAAQSAAQTYALAQANSVASASASALAAEATNRTNADASLQTQVNGKTDAAYVNAQVSAEATARVNGLAAEATRADAAAASFASTAQSGAQTYAAGLVSTEAAARATAIGVSASSTLSTAAAYTDTNFNIVSANGLFSVTSSAGSGVVGTVIKLMARATTGDTFEEAGITIEAVTSGPGAPYSRIVLDADVIKADNLATNAAAEGVVVDLSTQSGTGSTYTMHTESLTLEVDSMVDVSFNATAARSGTAISSCTVNILVDGSYVRGNSSPSAGAHDINRTIFLTAGTYSFDITFNGDNTAVPFGPTQLIFPQFILKTWKKVS